jgi:predicted nuclease with TOPRIM domain
MTTDNESFQPLLMPEVPPQTIPELYLRLVAELEHGFGALKKGFQEFNLELPEVETQRDEEQKPSSIDLQRRVDRLQREVSLMNKRCEWQESEIAYLKKALRDLERKVDAPSAAETYCPRCGTAFQNRIVSSLEA